MTDKREWLDWACLDWTGVGKRTGEWPRSSHPPSSVESGQASRSSSFFLQSAAPCGQSGCHRMGGTTQLRSPLISGAGHWLEPDRPPFPVVLSESILGRSFFARPGWDWAARLETGDRTGRATGTGTGAETGDCQCTSHPTHSR